MSSGPASVITITRMLKVEAYAPKMVELGGKTYWARSFEFHSANGMTVITLVGEFANQIMIEPLEDIEFVVDEEEGSVH